MNTYKVSIRLAFPSGRGMTANKTVTADTEAEATAKAVELIDREISEQCAVDVAFRNWFSNVKRHISVQQI